MNKYQILCFLIFSLFITSVGRTQYTEKSINNLSGPYFDQNPPVSKAEVFLDGIISTKNKPEMCAAFTTDGREFYYNALLNDRWAIFVTKIVHGHWTKAQPLSFTSHYTDRDFTMSPDGTKIYFGSNRPRKSGKGPQRLLDIFVTERLTETRWSEPKVVGFPVSTDANENYPSAARSGNLYFFSKHDDGIGKCEIYVSCFQSGRYQPAECLDQAVNSAKNDWDAFIAPDESYIIFSSQNRDDTIGGQDLYISYRTSGGLWTKAKNMGPRINSESGEICPSVSLNSRYLFFTSRRRGNADIFWIDAKIIDELKPRDIR